MAFPEGFSDISDTKKPPFGNEALTQGLLSYQNPKNNADSQWEKLVKSVAFRAEKERKELEETFPQEIRDTVMAIRRQYAYQEYFLDGKPASFDSLEAVWDPITKQISRSFIHLKQGDEKYNLPVLIDTDGDLSLNIQRGEKIFSVEETGKNIVNLSTQVITNKDPVDMSKVKMQSRKKSNGTPKNIHKGKGVGVKRVEDGNFQSGNRTVVSDKKEDNESESILTEHFSDIFRVIPGIDVTQVIGRRSQDGIYEMVFSIKDSPSIIVWKDKGKNYKVSASKNGDRDDSTDFGSRIIIGGNERKIRLQNHSLSLIPTERQDFLDRYNPKMSGVFSLNPGGISTLLWNNIGITLDQAKVIEAFENQEVDFGSPYGKRKIHINSLRTNNHNIELPHEIWLQREGREGEDKNNYFVIIIRNTNTGGSPVVASIGRNAYTPIFGTTANPEESKLIQAVRDRLKRP